MNPLSAGATPQVLGVAVRIFMTEYDAFARRIQDELRAVDARRSGTEQGVDFFHILALKKSIGLSMNCFALLQSLPGRIVRTGTRLVSTVSEPTRRAVVARRDDVAMVVDDNATDLATRAGATRRRQFRHLKKEFVR